MSGSIHAYLLSPSRICVTVVSDQGARLVIEGDLTDLEPEVTEGDVLASNPALLSNAWAYAKTWHESHTAVPFEALSEPDIERQKDAVKIAKERRKVARERADEFAVQAQWIADVGDDVSQLDVKEGWCSSCFFRTEHRKSNRGLGQVPAYVCQGCGSPTLPCAAPRCANLAVRERGAIRVPQFCAEHRHEIPGFEKAQVTIGGLHDYEQFLAYERPNLAKTSRVVVVGVAGLAAGAPVALAAAPAIGGAIGSLGVFGGVSGAAASAHGLALLGGGSLAYGGLGMAGGTAVVTAVGAAVGGSLGASVSNAYLREDRSFRIELLHPGAGGTPVVVANGFLTEGAEDRWGGWRELVATRYPDSPVYRVRWGAKELKDIAVFSSGMIVKTGGSYAVKSAGEAATRLGGRLVGRAVAPALITADLLRNPWSVAKSRADKTGVILGDLIARTQADSYVLIGHSLGARLMTVAASALGSKPGGPRIEAAHLLGAAVGARSNWDALTAAVDGAVYNYHSSNDAVLKFVYRTVQAGQSAAGSVGLQPPSAKLINLDVSDEVDGHSAYQSRITLA